MVGELVFEIVVGILAAIAAWNTTRHEKRAAKRADEVVRRVVNGA